MVSTTQVVTLQHHLGQRVTATVLCLFFFPPPDASRFCGSLVTRISMAGRRYFWVTTLLGEVWIMWLCAMKSSVRWLPRHGKTQTWSRASELGSWWRLCWAALPLHQHWRSRCWSKEEKRPSYTILKVKGDEQCAKCSCLFLDLCQIMAWRATMLFASARSWQQHSTLR